MVEAEETKQTDPTQPEDVVQQEGPQKPDDNILIPSCRLSSVINPDDQLLLLRESETLREDIEDDDDQDEDQLLENPLLDDILLDNLIEDSPLMPNTERSLLKPENLLDEAEAELDLMSPIKDEPRRMQAPRTYRADSYYDRAAAANEAQKSKPV